MGWLLVTLIVDFEFDLGRISPYSKYVRDTYQEKIPLPENFYPGIKISKIVLKNMIPWKFLSS